MWRGQEVRHLVAIDRQSDQSSKDNRGKGDIKHKNTTHKTIPEERSTMGEVEVIRKSKDTVRDLTIEWRDFPLEAFRFSCCKRRLQKALVPARKRSRGLLQHKNI